MRESFGNMLENEFNAGNSKVKVLHWACCKELHTENGLHYHCCMKLTGVKRWLHVKNAITKKNIRSMALWLTSPIMINIFMHIVMSAKLIGILFTATIILTFL